MPTIEYSVIVSTRNRAQRLAACLDSIATALEASRLAELVIVDNASTDNTSEVIERVLRRHQDLKIRVVREPRVGLSRARNTGVQVASAPFLVFTDDDCYVDPSYFINLQRHRSVERFDYFSGNIALFKETDAPEGGSLKKDAIERVSSGVILAPGHLQGSNMGFSRRIFDRIGEFNVLIGAGTPFRFEDIEFAARASLAGFEGIHLPDVKVVHDHGRTAGSPELESIVRQNGIAGGAYCCEMILLDPRRGLRYCHSHWRRLLSGVEGGGVERLRNEIIGAISFLWYLVRNQVRPTIRQDPR